MSSTFQKILALVGLIGSICHFVPALQKYAALVDPIVGAVVSVALAFSALPGKPGDLARAVVTDAKAIAQAWDGGAPPAGPSAGAKLVVGAALAMSLVGCSAAQKQAENAAAAKVFACLSSHATDFLTAGDPLQVVERYAADCGLADLDAAIAFFEALAHPNAAPQAAKARAALAVKRAAAK